MKVDIPEGNNQMMTINFSEPPARIKILVV
jgi:hypothetical protein